MNSFQKELEEINHFLSSYQFTNDELIKELNALVLGADDVVLLLYSRRALEVIITEMCEEILKRERGSEPLKGLIDRMYKEKVIPAYIHTSMSNLNSMSTYGAHPKEFNQRQVKSTIIELTTVIEWYINELKKLDKKEEISEKKAQEEKSVTKEKTGAPVKKETVQKDIPSIENKKKSKKPVAVITVLIVVVIAVAGYFTFASKNVPAEELKTEKNETVENDGIEDNEKAEIEVSETPEIIKDESLKETKDVPVNEIKLPENLQEAFNAIKEFPTAKRIKAANELLKRFSDDAGIFITNLGESTDARGYITGKLVLQSYDYEIEDVIKENGKISRLKIKEIIK